MAGEKLVNIAFSRAFAIIKCCVCENPPRFVMDTHCLSTCNRKILQNDITEGCKTHTQSLTVRILLSSCRSSEKRRSRHESCMRSRGHNVRNTQRIELRNVFTVPWTLRQVTNTCEVSDYTILRYAPFSSTTMYTLKSASPKCIRKKN